MGAFPESLSQVLALEFAKAKITPDTTPEEFLRMYQEALAKIREAMT